MGKRFKAKGRKKYRIIKYFFILLVIYVSFHLMYNFIYNLYLAQLNNEEIINHIIKNSKNGVVKKGNWFKYQNPQAILSDAFTFKEENKNVLVDSEIDETLKVYIYSTHETESYDDKYLEVYNIKPNVKMMGYVLEDYLEDLGIHTMVEDGSVSSVLKKNGWSYKYSYDASKELIAPVIKGNKDLQLIIDLHRDSAPLSKTVFSYEGEEYARILFVIGAEHENYEYNHNIAKKLNELLNEEIPGITRGISLKKGEGVNGIYNQDLSKQSVLIELGGQYNEIDEVNNTLKVLAKVILKYLEE